MAMPEVLETLSRERAWPVMVRAVLERAFDERVLDQVFACFAQQQRTRALLFSTCVSLMTKVVTRVQPSLGAAIRSEEKSLLVGRDCIYDKIAGLEDQVLSAALAVTATDLAALIDQLQGALPPVVPGLRTLVLDGNHLQAVQHRLRVLRGVRQAALPGTVVALLDNDRQLIVGVFLLQDGHASEMQVLQDVAAAVRPGDLVIADRNLNTRDFAAALEARGAYFLVREHGTRFPLEFTGERRFLGVVEGSRIYEQAARYEAGGTWHAVRRVTVELTQPTRDGDEVLHLLTNLPTQIIDPASGAVTTIDAPFIAAAYRTRWRIETAFQKLTTELRCELKTLGYPPAALFGFCVAALCYNAYQAALAALRSHHGKQQVKDHFSTYYLAQDVRAVWEGMRLMIPDATWKQTFQGLSIHDLAQYLRILAANVDPQRYRKAPARPRRPPVKGAKQRVKSHHLSIAKEIQKHSHDSIP